MIIPETDSQKHYNELVNEIEHENNGEQIIKSKQSPNILKA